MSKKRPKSNEDHAREISELVRELGTKLMLSPSSSELHVKLQLAVIEACNASFHAGWLAGARSATEFPWTS